MPKRLSKTAEVAQQTAKETKVAAKPKAPKKKRPGKVRQFLSVASEAAPLIKTGGLADVVGALPRYLDPLGWHGRVLLPAYPGVIEKVGEVTPVWGTGDLFGGQAQVLAGTHDGVDYLLLNAPHLFDRAGGPYNQDGHDYPDNHVRFAALSWVGARLTVEGTSEGWKPKIVHAHDWQAGLTPSYLKYAGSRVASVFTIHNLAFQGVFGADQLDRLKLPTWDFHPDALEYHGLVSALKAGMVHSAALTTVSPTYAKEIATPEFGFGLQGVVTMRRERGEMFGIVNGIDDTVWDPEHDPHTIPYSKVKYKAKADNRVALLREFGLPTPAGPLAVVVTRLTYQKGIDILLDAAPALVERGGALIVLGSGDADYEARLGELQQRYPAAVGLRIGYDEPLSHRMYAGGDIVVVPSRFEPCGLTQMYGLRYGAVPVVSATGGLVDTVVDATDDAIAAGDATGVTFGDISAAGLSHAFHRAIELYTNTAVWRKIRSKAMRSPVSWQNSARDYADLFVKLVE